MEWVETTGRTIEEAKDAALDELGVDEPDAEFEVLEEPKSGLFGRLRTEARVRARVRPATPRPKAERRTRRRRTAGADGGEGEAAPEATPAPADDGEPAGGAGGGNRRSRSRRASGGRGGAGDTTTIDRDEAASPPDDGKEPAMEAAGMTVAEQGEVASEFLEGLVDAFGVEGTIEVREVDEETVEVAVNGSDLGLLIGPRGQTLTAVQELARTVVQRQQAAPPVGRLRVDIGGYRERRREALERFTRDVAAQVLDSGVARALEPMSPPDRKVVHDTVNTIDGVATRSEGEEPRRRVVIVPVGDDA